MWTVALLTTNDTGTLETSQLVHILCILLMTIEHNTMICEEEPKLLRSPQLLINPNPPLMPNPTSYLKFSLTLIIRQIKLICTCMSTIHIIATWSEDLKVPVLEIRMELSSLTPSSKGKICYSDYVFLLARMKQHPPAHHPLDARHYSAVDELELIWYLVSPW